MTLTFDLLASKWGHGSPMPWASLLPILSFLRPSVLDLGSGTGQTDGQIDNGRQCIMAHPIRAGHKIMLLAKPRHAVGFSVRPVQAYISATFPKQHGGGPVSISE